MAQYRCNNCYKTFERDEREHLPVIYSPRQCPYYKSTWTEYVKYPANIPTTDTQITYAKHTLCPQCRAEIHIKTDKKTISSYIPIIGSYPRYSLHCMSCGRKLKDIITKEK